MRIRNVRFLLSENFLLSICPHLSLSRSVHWHLLTHQSRTTFIIRLPKSNHATIEEPCRSSHSTSKWFDSVLILKTVSYYSFTSQVQDSIETVALVTIYNCYIQPPQIKKNITIYFWYQVTRLAPSTQLTRNSLITCNPARGKPSVTICFSSQTTEFIIAVLLLTTLYASLCLTHWDIHVVFITLALSYCLICFILIYPSGI